METCPIRAFVQLFDLMKAQLTDVEASPTRIAEEMRKLPTAAIEELAADLREAGEFRVPVVTAMREEVAQEPLRALAYVAAIDLAFSRLHPLGSVVPLHLSRYRESWEADGWYARDIAAGWMVVPKWKFARRDRTRTRARRWEDAVSSLMIVRPLDLVTWHRLGGASTLNPRRTFDSFAMYPVLEPGQVDHVPKQDADGWSYLATPKEVGQLELIQAALSESNTSGDTVVLMPEAVVRASDDDQIERAINAAPRPEHVEVLIVGCGGADGERQVNEARVYDPRTGDLLFVQHKLSPYDIAPLTAVRLGILDEPHLIEERHDSDGLLHVLETDVGRFAVIICEDMQDNVTGEILNHLVRSGVSHLFVPIMTDRMMTSAEVVQAIKDGDPDVRLGANWEEATTNRLAGARGVRVFVANSRAMVTTTPANVAFARRPTEAWDQASTARERVAFEFDPVSQDIE